VEWKIPGSLEVRLSYALQFTVFHTSALNDGMLLSVTERSGLLSKPVDLAQGTLDLSSAQEERLSAPI
jgi:hypothetical protein